MNIMLNNTVKFIAQLHHATCGCTMENAAKQGWLD